MNQTTKLLITLILGILFCIAPATAATEQITNGQFNSNMNGWTVGPATNYAQISWANDNGNGYVYCFADAGSSEVASRDFSQTVDLTGVEALTFKTKWIESSGGSGTRLIVLIGGQQVAGYSSYELGGGGWIEKSIDVSQYTGQYTVTFRVTVVSNTIAFGIDDISAIAYTTPPTVTQVSTGSTATLTGQQTTATITYTAGDVTPATFLVNWGDGTGVTSYTSSSSPFSIQHTYQNPGTYTVTARGALLIGNLEYTTDPVTTQATVISADFTATPTSGPAPLTVTFIADISNANSLQWNFGDGSIGSSSQTIHTYTENDIYTVSLTATASNGKSVTVTKEDLITVADEYVRWDQQTYTAGDTATLTWSLINPNFGANEYALVVYSQDGTGNIGSPVTDPYPISSATGQTTIGTTGWQAGQYTAAITVNGVPSNVFGTATIQTLATLTVNIAANNVVWTNSTTVTLYKNGVQIDAVTTTNGTAIFPNIVTGSYNLIATTEGYNQQTLTVSLVSDLTVTMDFVKGSTAGNALGTGSGQNYAATFVTFRVLDEATGMPIAGATVSVVGKVATNPLDWIGQLFGAAWGADIVDTQMTGTSDDYGVVTFAMFPTVFYQITTTYGEITDTRSFQPSQLAAEYLIHLPVTNFNTDSASQAITTSVSYGSGSITANYTDSSVSTQLLTISVLLQDPTSGNFSLVESRDIIGSVTSQTFTLSDWQGQSYRVTLNATTIFGPVERMYGITFPGPRIKIGDIPDSLYIWISVFTLLILAAVGTRTTASFMTIIVLFVAWLMYFFGWLFELGDAAPFALSIGTALAILIYIVKR